MKKFIANRIINDEIQTIIGVLDEKQCTYSEMWYFNGRIYKEEKCYGKDSTESQYEYDLACRIYSKETQLIHE